MRNYLVKTLFEVRSANWLVHDRSHEGPIFEVYREMHELSCQSFALHLTGPWELVVVTGEVDNINQAFVQTFKFIHDLAHQEPCNILYTDPDTVAVRPVSIFGLFEHFMMFNHTDPRSFDQPNVYNRKFDNFFNAGVRYFPHSITSDIWHLGMSMVEQWDYSSYNTEQIILNAMLWDQGLSLEQALCPRLAYQAPWLPDMSRLWVDQWNNCSLDQAQIVHVHASRNARNKLAFMREISGIE